jgi:hypothetical protein
MTTGEIPRLEPLERVEDFWTARGDQFCPDQILDDQALAIDHIWNDSICNMLLSPIIWLLRKAG